MHSLNHTQTNQTGMLSKEIRELYIRGETKQAFIKSIKIAAADLSGCVWYEINSVFNSLISSRVSKIILRRSAEKGYAPAVAKYASMLLKGQYGNQDPTVVRYWLGKAAKTKNISAQDLTSYAEMHYEGTGGEKDLSKARMIFLQAAKMGCIRAMVFFSYMATDGKGGSKSRSSAKIWSLAAALKGSGHGVVQCVFLLSSDDFSPGFVQKCLKNGFETIEQVKKYLKKAFSTQINLSPSSSSLATLLSFLPFKDIDELAMCASDINKPVLDQIRRNNAANTLLGLSKREEETRQFICLKRKFVNQGQDDAAAHQKRRLF
ncbi:MAG: tetratricopeptide repeat protein [Pseudomonadota bacterium]|nr:tetratricopeptide repeat protein [Pseudomonadota bacterium]